MSPKPASKSSTSSPATPLPASAPEVPVVDRIPTPDGTSLEEVAAAVAAVERQRQERAARKAKHMPDCPVHRGEECACPANLASLPAPLEASEHAGATLIRVDDGYMTTREVQDPTTSSKNLLKIEVFKQPRWICTTCGWAIRSAGIGGHACDPSFLAFKAQPLQLSLTVPPEKRFGGSYMLTIWRDEAGAYHLGELVLEGDKVVQVRERLVDGDYAVIEGALNTIVVEEFTP